MLLSDEEAHLVKLSCDITLLNLTFCEMKITVLIYVLCGLFSND